MDNPIIALGWPRVRDLANMFIVLGFVVIGIATTLRIQDYQAKKLLRKLIIVALLINFSLLISGIMIDASNITAEYFLKDGGFFAISWVQTLESQTVLVWKQWKEPDPQKAAVGILSATTGLIFYDIISIVVFFLYGFLFLFRHMALLILVILSPLAFVCYVFPFTKRVFDMWWSNFFQWCIILIPVSFFIWISSTIVSEMSKLPQIQAKGLSLSSYLVPGFFMLIGFLFSLQTSAMGASMAIGAFKGTGKFAGSAINKTRLGDAGRGVKNLAARVGAGMSDRVGLTTGARSKVSASAVDKAHKDKGMGDHTNDEILKQIDRRGATGAAAFKEATKRKILNQYADGNVNRLAERATHAEGYGINRDDAEQLVPELARHNVGRVERLMGTVNPASISGATYTRPEAQQQAVRERNARQSVSNVKDLHPNQMNEQFAEDVNSRTFNRASLDFTTEQINHLKPMATPGGVLDVRQMALRSRETAERISGNIAQADLFGRQADNLGRNILHIRAL